MSICEGEKKGRGAEGTERKLGREAKGPES